MSPGFFNLFSMKERKVLAVIAFGWENERFYAKWMGSSDPRIAKELKGPILNRSTAQSKLAPALLKLVNRMALRDNGYIVRLKRHYK